MENIDPPVDSSASHSRPQCGQFPGDAIRQVLLQGIAIPAHPLALSANRKLDERSQRALSRYYLAAGAGGLAVGVHTTQFQIHDPKCGLLEPVLVLAAEEMDRAEQHGPERNSPAQQQQPLVRIAGICGETAQAVHEARLAQGLGYHAGLLNLNALSDHSEEDVLAHCRQVARIVPLFGFCLQSALGGPVLSRNFWTRFCEIDQVLGIKIAPFDRYQTLELVRGVAESQRRDIALYTGNDDNIVLDLLTPYAVGQSHPSRAESHQDTPERQGMAGLEMFGLRMVGGLLGHWAVWTKNGVDLLKQCHDQWDHEGGVSPRLLQLAVEVTDMNAALFDASHRFQGCIPGIMEILRRQGLVAGNWCLDEQENLSPGQTEQLDRVIAAYPHLTDDSFIAEHLDAWRS